MSAEAVESVVECHGNPRSEFPTCKCPRCKEKRRLFQARRRQGRLRDQRKMGMAAIKEMYERGYSAKDISESSGIDRQIVSKLGRQALRGELHMIMHDTAMRMLKAYRILATVPTAIGTRRRIEALNIMRWSTEDVARESGVPVWAVRAMRKGSPRATIDQRIAVKKTYERLCMTQGSANLAYIRAYRDGFAPPLAWGDDVDMDDPKARPHAVDLEPYESRRDRQRARAAQAGEEAEDSQ